MSLATVLCLSSCQPPPPTDPWPLQSSFGLHPRLLMDCALLQPLVVSQEQPSPSSYAFISYFASHDTPAARVPVSVQQLDPSTSTGSLFLSVSGLVDDHHISCLGVPIPVNSHLPPSSYLDNSQVLYFFAIPGFSSLECFWLCGELLDPALFVSDTLKSSLVAWINFHLTSVCLLTALCRFVSFLCLDTISRSLPQFEGDNKLPQCEGVTRLPQCEGVTRLSLFESIFDLPCFEVDANDLSNLCVLCFFTETETVLKAIVEARSCAQPQALIASPLPLTRSQLYPNSLRLNGVSVMTDAAWQALTLWCGLGWRFKDSSNDNLLQGASSLRYVVSALMAEALAIQAAISAALVLEIPDITVLSDSLTLILLSTSIDELNELKGLLHDRCMLVASFSSISFLHIKRTANVVADSLVKNVVLVVHSTSL